MNPAQLMDESMHEATRIAKEHLACPTDDHIIMIGLRLFEREFWSPEDFPEVAVPVEPKEEYLCDTCYFWERACGGDKVKISDKVGCETYRMYAPNNPDKPEEVKKTCGNCGNSFDDSVRCPKRRSYFPKSYTYYGNYHDSCWKEKP